MSAKLENHHLFDLDRIESESFVHRVEWHAQITSTSDRAQVLASDQSVTTPALVIADLQTNGRGRGKNRWWSQSGALTFSLLLETNLLTSSQETLPQGSLVTALAIGQALRATYPGGMMRLKWPNDVYFEGRKIAGILIEHPTAASKRLIVGIGINVNNSIAAAPDEIKAIATSLSDVSRRTFDLTDLLLRILHQLQADYEELVNGQLQLAERWRPFCLLTGHRVQLINGNQRTDGICRGIGPQGALLIEDHRGLQERYTGVVQRL